MSEVPRLTYREADWETSPRSPDGPVTPPRACNLLLAGLVSLAGVVGTNPTGALPPASLRVSAAPRATTNLDLSGLLFSSQNENDSRVRDLHRRWGLTVGQIAQLAGVSRRTVHTWLNGGSIRRRNLEELQRITDLLQRRQDVRAIRFGSRADAAASSGGIRALVQEVSRLEALASRSRAPIAPSAVERRIVWEDSPVNGQVGGRPAFGKVLGVTQAPGGKGQRGTS